MTSDFNIRPYHWLLTLGIALALHTMILLNVKSEQSQFLDASDIVDNELVISFKKLKPAPVPVVESKPVPPQSIVEPVKPPIKKIQAIKSKPVVKKPVIKKVVINEKKTTNDSTKQLIQPQIKSIEHNKVSTIKPEVISTSNNAKVAKPLQHTTSNQASQIAEHSRYENEKNRYMKQLVLWLSKHKKYPAIARRRNLQGDVLLRFVIDKNGQLLRHSIVRPSTHNSLNTAAIKMVKNASPMPKVPVALVKDKHEFEYTIPVEFSLSNN